MPINHRFIIKRVTLFTITLFFCVFAFVSCQITSSVKSVDNFEDNDNISLLGSRWYAQDDSSDGGNSKVDFKVLNDLGANNTQHCMQIDYKLGGLFRWPYIQVICPLENDSREYFDLSAYSGVSFYAKSKNLKEIRIVFFLYEEGVTDPGNSASFRPCEISLKTEDIFKEYKIDFSELKTATWWQNRYPKASKEIDWSQAAAMLIMEDDSLRAGAQETLWIDEISFYRDDLEISEISPFCGQQGLTLKTDIRLKFNFPLDEKKVDSFINFKKISGQEEGIDFSLSLIDNNKTVIITPKDELLPKSIYQVTIEKGLKSIYGNILNERFESRFYTEVGRGDISGIAKDAQGMPLEGALVTTYPGGLETKTDKKGFYSFENINLDNIVFYCQKDGYYTGFAKSEFSLEGNLNIMFTLDKVPAIDNQINPYIFGINYNDWETDGYLLPVVEEVREAGFTLIRWGGIGKDLIEVDEEKIDEFITFARDIGAEPMIEVRLIRGTDKEAAEAVRYCNIEKGYNVKYWLVGNEPDAYDGKDWGPYSAKDYAKDYRKYYNAMKAVDPTIKIGGPELMSKYWLSASDNWVTPFLEDCKDIIDFLSIHIYLFDGKQPIYQSLMGQKKVRYLIDSIRGEISKVAQRQIPLVVTEYNLTWDWLAEGEGACNSIAAGLWLADFLGTLAQEDVYMATFWDIMEHGTIGFLEHETKRPYPTYYTFLLYKTFRGTMLEATSDNRNLIAYTAKNGEETILIVVNKKTTEMIEVEISSENLTSLAECQLKVAGLNKLKQKYYCFPPLSMTRITFDKQGTVAEISYYSKQTYDAGLGIIRGAEAQKEILVNELKKNRSSIQAPENSLDNFEDGDYISFKGGVWIAENDSVNNGNSEAHINLAKDGNNNILKFDYRLGDKFDNRYAICAVVFDEPLDLNRYSGIKFKARGSNAPLKVKICSQAVGDYDYHGKKIVLSNNWQTYEIKFNQLQQEGWGKTTGLDLSAINKIQFETAHKTADEEGYVEIDDIMLIANDAE